MPKVLCAALQIATIVLIYYVQCYKKLHYNVVMHNTIVLLVLKGRVLHKGPGLLYMGHKNLLDSLLFGL